MAMTNEGKHEQTSLSLFEFNKNMQCHYTREMLVSYSIFAVLQSRHFSTLKFEQ